MSDFTRIEISVNQETLLWLQEEARHLTAAQEHQNPLTVADVVVLMIERQRRAQTEHETHPLE
jgi:hypothetical protein